MRFEFGKNWQRFVRRNFTRERCDIAKQRLLKFAGHDSLRGLDFLDIGCGSGLHSLAAHEAGAHRVFSFDYDPHSVAASEILRQRASNPPNWHIERGDVLNRHYIAELGKWSLVYCWGVLHHTGDVWQAVRNAESTVAAGGMFYLALYSSDVVSPEVQNFWLAKKQEYNKSGRLKRAHMMWWYIWTHQMQREWRRLPEFARRAAAYKVNRGMNIFSDIRDWLGGWPMEYVADQEVVDLLEQECGFELVNVSTGEACTEFLFRRTGGPARRTIVTEMAAANKRAATERAAARAHDVARCGSGAATALSPGPGLSAGE
jgi:2-polyprenyl-3-methyl-5-hydroxy-6-metoxy-1,4-benzoquinol methylase